VGLRVWFRLSPALGAGIFLFVSFFACRFAASATATPAGQVISNVATFTYTGNTGSFTGQSNTLSITVQNVPTMTVSTPTGINVTPGYEAIDTFTLTNTGNSPGIFQLTGAVTFAGGTTTPTVITYIVGTCTQAAPCTTFGQANSALTAIGNIGINLTQTVGVVYQVLTAATATQTVQPLLSAQVDYAGGTLLTATNSLTATNGAYSDTVIADARLDVKATAALVGSASITWTVTANDGGGYPAQGLQSAKALFAASATTNGIALFMAVPTFAGNGGQQQTLTATPASPTLSSNVSSTGTTATWYYNLTACTTAVAAGWTTGYSSSAKCLAVFLTNPSLANMLPLNGGVSSGAGSVTTPAVTAIFSTTQPSGGSGAGALGAVNLVASSAIGGDPWMTTLTPAPITGAPLTVDQTMDSSSATALNTIVGTVLASSGTTPPGGTSLQAQSNALAAYSIFVGPNAQPTASGAWNATIVPGYTSTPSTANNDFSFADYDTTPSSVNQATTYPAAAVGAAIANGGAATIIGTILNNGNTVDTVTLTASSNSPWSAAFYCYNLVANTCQSGDGATTCHATALSGGVVSSLASQASYNFCATFSTPPTNVTSLSAIAWLITGTSTGNGSTNTTWDVLYPGGVVVGFRTYAVSGCPGGTPPNGGIVSGCTVTYTAYFVNEAPLATAFSGLGNATVTPTTAVSVTENGSAVGSWGNLTGGLTVIPTTTNCGSCIFTTAGLTSKSFTVSIPAADLPPQGMVNYSYAVLEN